MKLNEFIFVLNESFPMVKLAFVNSGAPVQEVDNYLDMFKELVRRNVVTGPERDINHWKKQGWDNFKTFVDSGENIKDVTKRQIKQRKDVGRSINLYEDNTWLIVIPLDHTASCFHGKGTDWCTTKPSQSNFRDYFYRSNVTLIYLLNKTNGHKHAISYNTNTPDIYQLFDISDAPMSDQEFKTETGFSVDSVIEMAEKKQNSHIKPGRIETEKHDLGHLVQKAIDTDTRDPRLEKLLLAKKETKLILEYTASLIHGRWPEAEPILLTDIDSAVEYAKYYLKGKGWPALEPKIVDKPYHAYEYAFNILGRRWPEGEPAILADAAQDPMFSSGVGNKYAKNLIGGRWSELEEILLKEQDPMSLVNYANAVIDGRWKEAEPYIIKDPYTAYAYARDVILGRWPEAEPYIMKDKLAAYQYANEVIKGPWPEANPPVMSRKEHEDYRRSMGWIK